MDLRTAQKLAANFIYHPGWTFRFSQGFLSDSDHAELALGYLATESADVGVHGYDAKAPVHGLVRYYQVDLSRMRDAADLWRFAVDCIDDTNHHETTEFFRVRDGLSRPEAPFHPHKVAGNLMWQLTSANAQPVS